MKYYEIAVGTNTVDSELIADVVDTFTGNNGVIIVDRNDLNVPSWDYVEEGLLEKYDEKVLVKGFVEPDNLNVAVQNIKNQLEKYQIKYIDVSVRLVDDETWLNEWKKYYFPVTIGNIIVCPVWLDDKNEKNVLIDTGLAFGTGQHETTSMCISLMQKIDLVGKSVLDVGCGSGVLGLSAIKLGCQKVTFVDNDSQATETTSLNAKLNNYEKYCTIICDNLTDKINEKFDVVLANLTAPILEILVNDIDKVVKKGTHIILSGILNELSNSIEQKYGKYTLVDKEVKGIWTGLHFVV